MAADRPEISVSPTSVSFTMDSGPDVSLSHLEWDAFVQGLRTALCGEPTSWLRTEIPGGEPFADAPAKPRSLPASASKPGSWVVLRQRNQSGMANHLRRFGLEPAAIASDVDILPFVRQLAGEDRGMTDLTQGVLFREYARLDEVIKDDDAMVVLRRAAEIVPVMPETWRDPQRYQRFLTECELHAGACDDEIVSVYLGQVPKRSDGAKGWAFLAVDKNDRVVGCKTGMRSRSTSHNLEMVAFHAALAWAAGRKGVVLYVESAIVDLGYNAWLDLWSRQDWRTSGSRKIKSLSSWQAIEGLRRSGTAIVRPLHDRRGRDMVARASRIAFSGDAEPVHVPETPSKPGISAEPGRVIPLFLRKDMRNA